MCSASTHGLCHWKRKQRRLSQKRSHLSLAVAGENRLSFGSTKGQNFIIERSRNIWKRTASKCTVHTTREKRWSWKDSTKRWRLGCGSISALTPLRDTSPYYQHSWLDTTILIIVALEWLHTMHRIKRTKNRWRIKLQGKSTKWKRPKFTIGDQVRIVKMKRHFEKGYTPNWTEEVFVIDQILPTHPVTYKIRDLADEPIVGSFYEQQLQKTTQTTFRIDKVLR